MKRLSLQWRITLMSVLLIGITCVAMNLLLCSSGVYYMDTIADSLQGGGTVILNDGGAASFDPQLIAPNEELTIVVDGVQGRFRTTNWYITAAVTLLSGILAYFVSGRALKPLRSFASQVEQVQLNNLADMRIDEDAISEFRQLSRSFNQMLERLNNAFAAQRQFTGNAAHELRTPLALMQAQLELFLRGASRCAAGDGGIPHAFARADGAADADDQDAAGDEQFAAGGAERAAPARPHGRGDLHGSRAAGGEAKHHAGRRRATAL